MSQKSQHRSASGSGPQNPPPLSPGRKWAFRLAAAVALPVLLLLFLELGLRIVGYGYPTRFFLPSEIAGQKVLVQNDQFARRFFPAGLLRRPLPLAVRPTKDENTYRILVLGESAAMGDPDPAFSFGRVLETLLRQRYPEGRFELINTAFTAINSHAILPIARESAALNADLWIVYMGNNEMQGSFGAGAALGPVSPGIHAIRFSLWLRTTRVGQLLDSLTQRLRGPAASPETWTGLKMFVDHQIPPGAPARARVYANFEENLAGILAAGQRAGATVLLSTVASNLRDFAPFASQLTAELSEQQKAEWTRLLAEAQGAEGSGDCARVVELLTEAARIDPGFAELHFRLGQCQVSLDQTNQAMASFILARDLDALPLRTDSKLNQQITTAFRGQGSVIPFDAEAALARVSLDTIPGAEFFFEHVHFTFAGNYALALAMGEALRGRLPERVTRSDQGRWASQEHCASAMGWTAWHDLQTRETMLRRMADAPFTNILNYADTAHFQAEQISRLRAQLTPAALQAALTNSAAAAAAAPGDYLRHESHARLLEGTGDWKGALQAWQQVAELVPQYAVAHFQVGRFFSLLGQMDEAQMAFARALEERPDFPEARNEFGLMLLNQQRPAEALPHFQQVLQSNPDLVEARLNLGLALHRTGRTNAAVEAFTAALERRPNSPQVQNALATFYSEQQNLPQAAQHYRELIRLQPRNPGAHVQLAHVLAGMQQRDEALHHLRQAVEIRPSYWEARYLLGLQLAALERFREAELEFAEVVRQNPGHAAAHLNLAVALVKQERFAEARPHLQRVLELEPANQKAQQYLTLLQRLLNRPGPGQ
jgi:tetratricopeptide (TPR) repeat protein